MKNLRDVLREAEENKVAVGHFNISNLEGFWGIFEAAKKLEVPVVIGVSEGERDFMGIKQVAAIVHSVRDNYAYPLYLNADHTYSLERIKEVVEAGYDSVIFDGAKLSVEENTRQTKEVVEYVRVTRPEVLVEAEVGYIGSSSKMLDELPEGAALSEDALPTGEDAKQFVLATGVDLIAPAVGNIHGMLKNAANPKLHINRIREIREQSGVPLVLHGGSGISDDDFLAAIDAGIAMIHINTEIRLAWRKAVAAYLQENPDEVVPYKVLEPARLAVAHVVEQRLRLYYKK